MGEKRLFLNGNLGGSTATDDDRPLLTQPSPPSSSDDLAEDFRPMRFVPGGTSDYPTSQDATIVLLQDPSSAIDMHTMYNNLAPPATTTTFSAANSILVHENLKTKSMFVKRYLKHNPLLNYLLPISCILVLLIIVYVFRDFPRKALQWIEGQEANSWLLIGIFMLLFVVVSFPVTVGYLVLIITSGYLFGAIKGLLIVIIGANFGVAVAHYAIRSLQNKLPVHKLIKNETGRAILRVISGPRAFKVVLFCRLTPIPFGLQNTIFGVSAVGARSYHTGTLLGLLPAQTINVYLGSTLRSMHDVLNDHKTAFAGYSVFAVEVLIGVLLMVWVVQKARVELSNALLEDIGVEEKKLLSAKSPNKEFQNALVAWLKKSLKVAKRHLKKRYRNRRQDKAHLGRLANYNLANNISDKRNNSYVYRMV